MFNNLIESSSHKREFKRRGSFFLFTVAAYTLLFTVGGIASIYAYEAHLDEQNTEITILTFAPPPPVNEVRPPSPRPAGATPTGNPHTTVASAPVIYESASAPRTAPENINTAAPVNLPTVDRGYRQLGPLSNPLSSGGPGNDGPGNGGGNGNRVVEIEVPPPAAAAPTPVPKQIIKSPTILNGKAIDLPKPPYPVLAKNIHLSGAVNVQVLIDESGKVISVKAVSGHGLLTGAAEQAAWRARFSPTKIGETPVKVSGIIVYNFVLQ